MATEVLSEVDLDAEQEVVSDDDDGEVDPRIRSELDKLNLASTEINRLENELDEARTKYRSIVSSMSSQMELIAQDRKKSIHKAREYFRLVIESKLAQSEALKAARLYQSAVGVYKAAKETVTLAENSLCEITTHGSAHLSSAWQETLNHAVAKVMEAEKEKARSEEDHKKRAAKFAEIEARKQVLEKKYSRSIKKAKPYFELKAELDVKLMQQKQNVIDLQAAIKCNKGKYTASLRKLETISEEIHQIRRDRLWSKIPRMPGVGADNDSEISGMSEVDLNSLASFYSESAELSDDEAGDTDDSTFTPISIPDTPKMHEAPPVMNTDTPTLHCATSTSTNVDSEQTSKVTHIIVENIHHKTLSKEATENVSEESTNAKTCATGQVLDNCANTERKDTDMIVAEGKEDREVSIKDENECVELCTGDKNVLETNNITETITKQESSIKPNVNKKSNENAQLNEGDLNPTSRSECDNETVIQSNILPNTKPYTNECESIDDLKDDIVAVETNASNYNGLDMKTVERPSPSGEE